MNNIKTMANALTRMGVREGGTLLVHSSLKSLGGGVSPSEVIEALLAALGEGGTLVMPALSYKHCGAGNPVFDYYKTPSNVGAIPEFFRGWESARFGIPVRSLCPTHSCCAVGARSEYIVSGHILDNTPCGRNSPFARVKEAGGSVLFLGCGTRPNTSMHAVEEIFEPDYLFGDYVDYRITDKKGGTFNREYRAHNFKGVAQRYERLEPLMRGKNGFSEGKVLSANCVLLDAAEMWKVASEAYSANSCYFIDIH